MAAPSYDDSKEELINAMRGTAGSGNRQFDIAKAILEIKAQEDITRGTNSLNWATWVLAFATIGLFVATVVLVYVTLIIR